MARKYNILPCLIRGPTVERVDAFDSPDRPPAGAPGWYPDPAGSGSYRYWDGSRWTDAVSSAIPPAGPHDARDDARTFALAAHLSALLSVFVGALFTGPLVILLVKKDDPFVRGHAVEALNFNLSVMLCAAVVVIVGLLLPLVWLALVLLAFAWFVLTCIAASKAGQGEPYAYPLTIRFVRD
jgi:uncharacterized Tic20 family protein